MTKHEYKSAIALLGWSQERAAEMLDISLRTSNSYANGARIPKTVDISLRLLLVCKLDAAGLEKLLG